MGHNRLGPLARTRKFNRVVGLIRGGAGVEQVANATTDAVEKELLKACNDKGVIEAVWLLMHLPIAARTENFTEALRECGLIVSDNPGLLEIVTAVTEAIDAKMPNCQGRTDLGEMAQMAAAETLTEFIGGRLNGLFETTPTDVQRELARLRTSKQFGLFARDFFARFINRCLNFSLSKTLSEQVGEGERFQTLAGQAEFTDALDTHCRETAKIVEVYAGNWLMLHHYETDGKIDRQYVSRFTAYAMKKLTDELRQRDSHNGP